MFIQEKITTRREENHQRKTAYIDPVEYYIITHKTSSVKRDEVEGKKTQFQAVKLHMYLSLFENDSF